MAMWINNDPRCGILSSLFHLVSQNITSPQCTAKQSENILCHSILKIINASYKRLPLELIRLALAVLKFHLIW